MQLEAHQLAQRDIGNSVFKPFDPTPGFTEHWWVDYLVGNADLEWWSYHDVRTGEELARAEIEPSSTCGHSYHGVICPPNGFAEIVFIEIREDRQREGLGRAVVDMLAGAYHGKQFAAFSEADEFWSAIGWLPHWRADVPDPERHRTLFLSTIGPESIQ